MSASSDRVIANMEGQAALPRKNGELVFEAPWEGRAFGMAVVLSERRLYDWDEFRSRLIDEIAAAERRGEPSSYYERWLASFERVLIEKDILARGEIEARTAEYAAVQRDEVF
jgi:nitrile hydratase accessory protein